MDAESLKWELIVALRGCDNDALKALKKCDKEFLTKVTRQAIDAVLDEAYDPNFGDQQPCVCGHPYYRHFDTYDKMSPVGCKYCNCDECPGFRLKVEESIEKKRRVVKRAKMSPDPNCRTCWGRGTIEVFFDSYTAQSEFGPCTTCLKACETCKGAGNTWNSTVTSLNMCEACNGARYVRV